MGRHKKPEEERKVVITIRLSQWLVQDLKQIPKYNVLIEELLTEYINKEKNR